MGLRPCLDRLRRRGQWPVRIWQCGRRGALGWRGDRLIVQQHQRVLGRQRAIGALQDPDQLLTGMSRAYSSGVRSSSLIRLIALMMASRWREGLLKSLK